MNLTPIDIVRGVLSQAINENLTLADLYACAENAAGMDGFADAVNIIATMTAQKEPEA